MYQLPPSPTLPDTLLPYATLFRSAYPHHRRPWALLRALPFVPARRSTSLQWHRRPRRTGSENVSSSQSLSTPPPKARREDLRSGGRSLIIPCASRKLFNAFGDMAFLDHQRQIGRAHV